MNREVVIDALESASNSTAYNSNMLRDVTVVKRKVPPDEMRRLFLLVLMELPEDASVLEIRELLE